MAWFSPKRRFVETSGDVIERLLAISSLAVNVNLRRLQFIGLWRVDFQESAAGHAFASSRA
jgi:biotin operon repressor